MLAGLAFCIVGAMASVKTTMSAYPLSTPGPKEAAVSANSYHSRGYPMAHHLYRHLPGGSPW